MFVYVLEVEIDGKIWGGRRGREGHNIKGREGSGCNYPNELLIAVCACRHIIQLCCRKQ